MIVPNEGNFAGCGLLKAALVPIKVTDSNVRKRAKCGDYDHSTT
jgi:hypothetical protein